MQLNSKTKKARARDLRLLFAGPVRSWELQELKEELPSATVPLPEASARRPHSPPRDLRCAAAALRAHFPPWRRRAPSSRRWAARRSRS
jgi:hypothetical protein